MGAGEGSPTPPSKLLGLFPSSCPSSPLHSSSEPSPEPPQILPRPTLPLPGGSGAGTLVEPC